MKKKRATTDKTEKYKRFKAAYILADRGCPDPFDTALSLSIEEIEAIIE